MHATGSVSPQQVPRRQNTTLLLAGTALLSVISGYLLATYEFQNSGSTRVGAGTPASGLDNPQYGTAEDFRSAIEELKATFLGPGAVSDDPQVLEPYGFSENDYHPGTSVPILETDLALKSCGISLEPHRGGSPTIDRRRRKNRQDSGQVQDAYYTLFGRVKPGGKF